MTGCPEGRFVQSLCRIWKLIFVGLHRLRAVDHDVIINSRHRTRKVVRRPARCITGDFSVRWKDADRHKKQQNDPSVTDFFQTALIQHSH